MNDTPQPSVSRIPLVIVAALGRNGAIGRDNQLPWSMPSDLARFRTLTVGKPMIMGRRTFESIGRVLPGRDSIVVTRSPWGIAASPGLFVATDPDDALALAGLRATIVQADSIALIGGATLFANLMPRVDRLHLTIVDLEPEADVFFPPIDPAIWREERRVLAPRHDKDEATCAFVDYGRVVGPSV